MKKVICLLLCCCLMAALSAPALAAPAAYPGVTEEMTTPEYWSALTGSPTRVLADSARIAQLNDLYLRTANGHLSDLAEVGATFDGPAMNRAAYAQAEGNASYFAGWTYQPDGTIATKEYYQPVAENCKDPRAQGTCSVRYGIVVNRTTLLALPTAHPILDEMEDRDFDYRSIVGMRVNEPVVVYTTSADGAFYYVKTDNYMAWLPVEDVALCRDREEWLAAWQIPAEKRLVFWGDRMTTDTSLIAPETSGRLLTMGTVLERITDLEATESIHRRIPWHNYAVWLPVRQADGSYTRTAALINAREKVSEDYLPLTAENLAKVALSTLGDAYGWGGSLNNEDCTSIIRVIYLCFGLSLPRSDDGKDAISVVRRGTNDTCTEEKERLLDALPLGSILDFPGHQILYLGKAQGDYWVISSTGSIMDPAGSGDEVSVRGCVITPLSTLRGSGNTWLQDINRIIVPWVSSEDPAQDPLPGKAWYHDALAVCMNKGIIVGVGGGYAAPYGEITRAALLQILWSLEGKPASTQALPYADVDGSRWYAGALRWAVEKGLSAGAGPERFGPNDPIDRQEMVTILYRYAKLRDPDKVQEADIPESFTDRLEVSPEARPAMGWAIGCGIVHGMDAATLAPTHVSNRAQVAQVINTFLELFP